MTNTSAAPLNPLDLITRNRMVDQTLLPHEVQALQESIRSLVGAYLQAARPLPHTQFVLNTTDIHTQLLQKPPFGQDWSSTVRHLSKREFRMIVSDAIKEPLAANRINVYVLDRETTDLAIHWMSEEERRELEDDAVSQ